MARSDTVTLISLDRAAKILGIDPYHFNTIVTLRRPENNTADDIWFDSSWMRVGQAGRQDLALALYEAERQVINYLGFYPMPAWVSEEEHRITQPYAVELRNIGSLNSRNRQKSIRTKYGYVIEAGSKAKTVIQAGANVVYSDADGDGYNELVTVTVNTTVTNDDEIHVFFAGKSGVDAWEIRPITTSLNAGVATITFQRYQVPLPELWERDPSEGDIWRTIDGDNINNFVTTVDVYRVYTDVSTQATLYYEDGCDNCNGSGCIACEFSTNTGCLRIRDKRLGLMSYSPATWDDDAQEFNISGAADPDKISINYRAGYIPPSVENYSYRQMDPVWERAIVFYAFSLLERVPNVTGNTENVYQRFNEDLALSAGGKSYTIAFKNLQNPLGTTRAAINLWRMIERERLL